MGRYETLNANTKDLVNCMLPAIAANFAIQNIVDVIPQDIRMRQWDCDRRDHIKDKSEDDPRNWGVQFLRDLVTISRFKQGKLEEFQDDLRLKVKKHGSSHPWARLADIKEIKILYESPEQLNANEQEEGAESEPSSDDSYFQELVEQQTNNKKRGRKPNRELYESRPLKSRKRKPKRLRRDSSVGWERRGKQPRLSLEQEPESPQIPDEAIRVPDEELEALGVEELEAQLALAEAELRIARLRVIILAKRRLALSGDGQQGDQNDN